MHTTLPAPTLVTACAAPVVPIRRTAHNRRTVGQDARHAPETLLSEDSPREEGAPAPNEATRLLNRLGSGDARAADELLSVLYAELREVAGKLMQRERADHTMQPTALVHEAFLRLVHTEGNDPDKRFADRVHFVRVAARAMRNALIDHARAQLTDKRGGGNWREVTLVDDITSRGHGPESLLAVDETLERLHAFDPQLAQIVELRFFGGLKDREIAAAIDSSERSVQRGWRTARAWMMREMDREAD